MSKYRFVEPDIVRLELSEGDWIEVKKELTYGEQQRLSNAAMTRFQEAGSATPRVELDFERYQIVRLKTWLVAWSFRDLAGKPVEITANSLSALHPDAAAEIDAALTAHIEALETAKNSPEPPSAESA